MSLFAIDPGRSRTVSESHDALAVPSEPAALRTLVRTALEESPTAILPLVVTGRWIADPLWEGWRDTLERRGMSRGQFDAVVAGYGQELRLWVVGERPWGQYASGIAGRVVRRLNPAAAESGGNGSPPAWRAALERVGVSVDDEVPTLVGRIGELHLLHDLRVPEGNGSSRSASGAHAIVWAGARPRDPEAPVGEGRSVVSAAAALAEALGRFLLRDPAYPPR
jgi:hypothetical protein